MDNSSDNYLGLNGLKEYIDEIESNPLLTGPKRQHFLPKFYLEGFTRNGRLAIYDREMDEVRVQAPINTCVIGHFYTFQDTEGRKRFEIERTLGEYETKANVIINKLSRKKEISLNERIDLSIFIAMAVCRTPDMIDSVKNFRSNFIRGHCQDLFADVGTVMERLRGKPDSPVDDDELEALATNIVEVVRNDQYQVTVNHSWAVAMSLSISFVIAEIFAGRNWVVFHRINNKKSFVTTDSPILLTTAAPRKNNFWGVGYGNSDAVVLFPLTESSILMIYGDGETIIHQSIGKEQIRHFNLAIAEHCQRFLIARDEELVLSIKNRLNLANRKWQPKMQRLK